MFLLFFELLCYYPTNCIILCVFFYSVSVYVILLMILLFSEYFCYSLSFFFCYSLDVSLLFEC